MRQTGMSCGQQNYPTSGTTGVSFAAWNANPVPANSQILIVCDAPEVVPQYYLDNKGKLPLRSQAPPDTPNAPQPSACPANTYTLYRTQVNLKSGTSCLRVFFWHVNHYENIDLNFLVSALTTDGTPVAISGARLQLGNDNSIGSGLCVAKATFYQTLAPFTPISSNLGSDESVIFGGAIPRFSGGAGGFCGGVIEFQLTTSTATTLQLRTSVTEALNGFTPSGSMADPVATPWQWPSANSNPVKHNRGTWPYSAITLQIPGTYDVQGFYVPPGQQGHVWTFGVLGNGHDSPEMNPVGGFGQQASDIYGTLNGNFGCYGANLSYLITLINGASTGQYLGHFAMTAEGVAGPEQGPAWSGAVSIVNPTGFGKFGMPTLQTNPPPTTPAIYTSGSVSLNPSMSEIGVGVSPGGAVPVTISLQFAGDSSSPVAIVLTQGPNWTNPGGPS